jgi:GT2 family glycosyltransferase
MVREAFPRVLFVQSEQNIGFARANNLGVNHSTGCMLAFLNPDTEVERGALDELYRASHSLARRGIVGCRLLNTDRTLQRSCVMPSPTIANQVLDSDFLQVTFPRCPVWLSALTYDGTTSPSIVDAVSGACMLVSRDVLHGLGGFSTDYFMYAEDLDLCCKAMNAGLQNYYVPTAQIVHHGGGSSRHSRSSFSNVMMRESLLRLMKKIQGPIYARLYRASMGVSAICRLAMLALLSPLLLVMHRLIQLRAAFGKWLAILRWSIGLERWVKQFTSRMD